MKFVFLLICTPTMEFFCLWCPTIPQLNLQTPLTNPPLPPENGGLSLVASCSSSTQKPLNSDYKGNISWCLLLRHIKRHKKTLPCNECIQRSSWKARTTTLQKSNSPSVVNTHSLKYQNDLINHPEQTFLSDSYLWLSQNLSTKYERNSCFTNCHCLYSSFLPDMRIHDI